MCREAGCRAASGISTVPAPALRAPPASKPCSESRVRTPLTRTACEGRRPHRPHVTGAKPRPGPRKHHLSSQRPGPHGLWRVPADRGGQLSQSSSVLCTNAALLLPELWTFLEKPGGRGYFL